VWITGVIVPVVGLAMALPLHYMGHFNYDWVSHLGPIYVGTIIYVVGAVVALLGLSQAAPGAARASDRRRSSVGVLHKVLTVPYRSGAPEEIRTPDPQIRSLVLYPAELRARFSLAFWGARPADAACIREGRESAP
jgi:hypothetical protein